MLAHKSCMVGTQGRSVQTSGKIGDSAGLDIVVKLGWQCLSVGERGRAGLREINQHP